MGNLTHVFLDDGRRVQFDKRDGSVTVFPDRGFNLRRAHFVGTVEKASNGWLLRGIDGGSAGFASSRKEAALTLLNGARKSIELTEARLKSDRRTEEEAVALIREVLPDYRPTYFGDLLVVPPETVIEIIRALR